MSHNKLETKFSGDRRKMTRAFRELIKAATVATDDDQRRRHDRLHGFGVRQFPWTEAGGHTHTSFCVVDVEQADTP